MSICAWHECEREAVTCQSCKGKPVTLRDPFTGQFGGSVRCVYCQGKPNPFCAECAELGRSPDSICLECGGSGVQAAMLTFDGIGIRPCRACIGTGNPNTSELHEPDERNDPGIPKPGE